VSGATLSVNAMAAPRESTAPDRGAGSFWGFQNYGSVIVRAWRFAMFEAINPLIDKKEVPGNLVRAVELLNELKKQHPAEDLIRGKLSHAYYFKGRFQPEGSREREHLFELGMESGREAVTLNPRSAYGHFWYAANTGLLGLARGIMQSLRGIEPMHQSLLTCLKENERFFFAGPHRALGRLYHQAPGWPLSIGSKTKAVEHLERAVELAPQFFLNRLFLIEFYVDVGKKKQAQEHVDYMLNTPMNPDHVIEDGEYRDQAAKIRQRIM
jgi:tetratricopeptide (TPR) repeat protein